jgi:hypothetical protein
MQSAIILLTHNEGNMKTLGMILVIMTASLFSNALVAQVSVGINFGVPAGVRYYYLQDIEAYYDVQASMYIYPSGNRWIHARSLPGSYGHYDINNGHRVAINGYRGSRPYSYYNDHRERFPKGHYDNPGNNSWSAKDHRAQQKRNDKAFKKDVRQNNKDHGNNGKGNGHGNGKGKGR